MTLSAINRVHALPLFLTLIATGISQAAITGSGITVNLAGNTAGTNTLVYTGDPRVFTIGNSAPITPGSYTAPAGLVGPIGSAAGNQATASGGGSITPVYQRGDYKWDTEQLFNNSPAGERVVVEGRIGNRASNGDIEAQVYNWSYENGANPYEQHVGNPTPSAGVGTRTGFNATTGTPFIYNFTADPVGSAQSAISSGVSIPLTVHYNHVTRFLNYTFGSSAVPAYAVAATEEFDGLLLRNNVSDRTDVGMRTLSLTNLNLEVLDAAQTVVGNEALISSISGTNSLTASATSTGTLAGQRQFGLWYSDFIDDDASFRITGDATFTWTTSTAPSGSQMAFQLKFVEDLTVIPEPNSLSLLAAATMLALSRRRRKSAGPACGSLD